MHFYCKYAQPPTYRGGGHIYGKKIIVNMPPLKSSLIKPMLCKSMLFFHIWNANFSVTPINSQMYMTKPKQVQKKLSENTGKTFSVIMPPFTSRGGGGHNYGNDCTFRPRHRAVGSISRKCIGIKIKQTSLSTLMSTWIERDAISGELDKPVCAIFPKSMLILGPKGVLRWF